MKRFIAVWISLAFLLAACQAEQPEVTSEPESSQEVSLPEDRGEAQEQIAVSETEPSQRISPEIPGQSSVEQSSEPVYVSGEPYRPDNPADFILYFENEEYLMPLARPSAEVLTGADLVQMLFKYTNIPNADMEITVSGNIALVNYLDGVIQPARTSSIAETLLRGSSQVERVQFFAAGKPYVSGTKVTDNEGFYIPAGLQIPPLSVEQITALRAQVPYHLSLRAVAPAMKYHLLEGEEIERLTEFLYSVHWYNRPVESFDTVEEAPPRFLLTAAIYNTGRYLLDRRLNDTTAYYGSVLEPLENWGSYNGDGYLKEHVEQTARYFFGDDVTLDLEAVPYMHGYNEYSGIISDYGSEHYVEQIPVILEYQKNGPIYEMVIVHLVSEIGGGKWCDNERNPLEDSQVAAYCMEKADRYKVRIEQQADGSFRYLSCQVPDK